MGEGREGTERGREMRGNIKEGSHKQEVFIV